jgi:hypothetical protein
MIKTGCMKLYKGRSFSVTRCAINISVTAEYVYFIGRVMVEIINKSDTS